MTRVHRTLILHVLALLVVRGSTTYSQTNFWEPAGATLGNAIGNIAIAPNGHVFARTSNNVLRVYRSTDDGGSWDVEDTAGNSIFINAMTVSHTSGTLLFAGGPLVVYRSTNEGASWATISGVYAFMNLTSSPTGILFAGTPTNGISRSTDDGLTWEKVNTGLTQFSISAFAFNDSGYTFAASYGGAVYCSTNNGESWTPIPIVGSSSDVLDLVSQKNGSLFAATSIGVYRTSDNGAHWIDVSSGLTSISVRSLCLNSRQHLFAATAGGVFRSLDLGGGWATVNSGLLDSNVCCLALASDGRLYAGTASGQVFRSVGSTNSAREPSAGQIAEFVLGQNFPNPFNPSTTIRYGVPRASRIRVVVFDVLGRPVATLIDGWEQPGYHDIRFDATGLASGVYFYRLLADGVFTPARKILLLR